MTGKNLRIRVKQLMTEYGIDIKDEKLFINICIIYIEAQKDQLKEDMQCKQ